MPRAAENLLRYLADQAAATGAVPDDRTIVIERCRDELGDWRVCVLSPFGGRVHAPWAMAAVERARAETGLDVETMWTDDGFVVRFPETEAPPDPALLLPAAEEVEALVVRQLGGTALFAAQVPRGRGARAAPAAAPAGRAHAALAAAQARGGPAGGGGALRIVPDAARDLSRVPARRLRHAGAGRHADAASNRARSATVTVDSTTPSPFAASLLFGYVANYIYDGDAPLAERRAQALSIDQAQLRELLGEAELRELLDPDALGGRRAPAAAARRAISRARRSTASTICCCGSAI